MNHKRATRPFTSDLENALGIVGGRNRYNRQRQDIASERRLRLVQLLRVAKLDRGFKAKAARKLGCHRATVARDLRAIASEARKRRQSELDDLRELINQISEHVHGEILDASGAIEEVDE